MFIETSMLQRFDPTQACEIVIIVSISRTNLEHEKSPADKYNQNSE